MSNRWIGRSAHDENGGSSPLRRSMTKDPAKPVDCHPLIREYFAGMIRTTAVEAFCEGHSRLYEYYGKQAPERLDTLEEMSPLFYGVYHGCQAGRYQEALEVFGNRVYRGREAYLIRKLGAFTTDLSLLANFFERPWTQPVSSLTTSAQAWVINNAAFALRAPFDAHSGQ